MEFWQLWGVLAVVLFVIEMLTPALFFLNLSLAAVVMAIITYFVVLSGAWQFTLFAVLSIPLLAFLRPFLLHLRDSKDTTGLEATYYGKEAKVTEKITENSGRITIFGEAWDARTRDGIEIEAGETVVIKNRKDLTMIVSKKGE